LLIGAGGSARGVAHALLASGCRRVVVANAPTPAPRRFVAALDDRRAHAAGLDHRHRTRTSSRASTSS